LGIVSRVYPTADLQAEAVKFAASLATSATVGLGLTKRLVNAGFHSNVSEYLIQEGFAQATAFTTGDHAEGVQAFLSKRRPRFSGA
jgi:2-(1,2-epoxy-1,2-dihydrophenyl)acetyl-CoA isomerase